MPAKTHEVVNVTFQNGRLSCDPDWVHLYWNDGPADIRWVFKDAPTTAASAVVEFHTAVPGKYRSAGRPPERFRPRGVHRGVGHARASAGSHLQDILTTGNTREVGYFYYDVKLLDGAGKVIAQADPGGDNGPGG